MNNSGEWLKMSIPGRRGLRTLWIFLVTFVILILNVSKAQPFSVGESIEYKIYASGFVVGYQTITVVDRTPYRGRDAWIISGRSKTSPFVSIFYRLDDKWKIYVDGDTFLPLRVEKGIVEGKRRGYLIYEIYQNEKKIIIKDKNGKLVKKLSFKNDLFDLFSLIYYFRSYPEKFGNEFLFDFLEEKSVRTVKFRRDREIKIKIPSISRRSVIDAMSITQVGGIGIKIIVGRDELKLPLRMIVPSRLPGNKRLNIIFSIYRYTPGKKRHKIPRVYRKIMR